MHALQPANVIECHRPDIARAGHSDFSAPRQWGGSKAYGDGLAIWPKRDFSGVDHLAGTRLGLRANGSAEVDFMPPKAGLGMDGERRPNAFRGGRFEEARADSHFPCTDHNLAHHPPPKPVSLVLPLATICHCHGLSAIPWRAPSPAARGARKDCLT
ncbi:protein of unknown function [Hyphomicrobium sp. 1Nfss2.1]